MKEERRKKKEEKEKEKIGSEIHKDHKEEEIFPNGRLHSVHHCLK